MKKSTNGLISLALVICLVLSLFSSVLAAPSATLIVTTPSGYTSASEVNYKTAEGYLINWGARGEDCGFLSTYAQSFYTGSYQYETLSKVSGGTSTGNAPSSALYSSLQTLMTSKHTTFTSYGGSSTNNCKDLYQYTDCMLGDPTYVSTLYKGLTVGGAWVSNGPYNQEHVWPNSKCIKKDESPDVGDIMHLRAANPNENSSRGNKAYGESSSYYDPGVSVRGDCARTVLYMYVRWGNTQKMWGSEGVIESLDILLDWIREDPVDTWEMGRNDAVQSITGTRNVFVDYPEYAYLLFGEAVPADLTTPSTGGDPNANPGDGNVGGNTPGGDTPGGDNGNTNSSGTASLVTNASSLKVGDQIVIAALEYDFALSTTQNNNNRGHAAVTKSGNTLSFGSDTQILTLEEGSVSGTFAFQAGTGAYLYAPSSSSNHLKTTNKVMDNGSWAISIDSATGNASITASGAATRNTMRYNGSSALFSCYAPSNTQKDVAVYKLGDGSGDTPETPEEQFTVSFAVPDGVPAIADQLCGQAGITLPTAGVPEANPEYRFVGWTTEALEDTDVAPAILSGNYVAEADVTLYALYSYVVGATDNAGWQLVTDAKDLAIGDAVVLASNQEGKVAGTIFEQYLSVADAVFSQDLSTITNLPEAALILTLGKSDDGSWTLTNEAGQQLGAYAVKKVAWDNGTATWTIDIDENSLATVYNTDASFGRFLYNVNSPRFTTYTSDTKPSMLLPQLYKLEGDLGTTYYTTGISLPTGPATPDEPTKPTPTEASLAVKVTPSASTVEIGDTVEFTVTATGTQVTAAEFEVVVPEGLTYVAGSAKIPEGLKAQLGWIDINWYEPSMLWNGYSDLVTDIAAGTVILTFSCTADAAGSFEVDLVHFDALDPNFCLFDVTVEVANVTVKNTNEPTDPEDNKPEVKPTGSITGKNETKPEGTAVKIELISGGKIVASTDAADSYKFENLEAGTYTLKVSLKNHVTREYTVTVADKSVTQNVQLHLIGDIDGNGKVNVGDVAKLYAHVKKTSLITDEYILKCLDITGEGKINVGDTAKLYAHVKKTSLLW